jgi:hypothetical protein
MRRICPRCAGRPLCQRSMRAPVIKITDIFGQDFLQMALIEDEHVVQALGSDGSHPALGYGVGSRRSEWCANLGNTNIAHPTIECVSALIKVDPGVLKDCGPSRCARWSVRRAVSLDRTISDATRGSSRVMFDYREHCGAGPGVRARAPRGTQPSTPIARAGQSRLPLEACNPYSGSTPPEAYSRPDRTWEQPLRAAAVQGWRAAPPEGLVLDWREHDGSIGRLGA